MKAKIIGIGKECKKCQNQMQRRKRGGEPTKKQKYYFQEWDYCEPCRHVQHYEHFKRINKGYKLSTKQLAT